MSRMVVLKHANVILNKVEVKPQALEWILATAAGFRYFASADNLNGNPGDTQPFKQAVYEQVKTYAEKGLPKRAETLRHALAQFMAQKMKLIWRGLMSRVFNSRK